MYENPSKSLEPILHKLCLKRGISVRDYVPLDSEGELILLSKRVGKIPNLFVDFTKTSNYLSF